VISQKTALAWSGILGLVFTFLITLVPVSAHFSFPFIDLMTLSKVEMVLPLTILFVGFLGLANALVWPAVWPLAIHDLGRFIKTGSAMLIMAIAGGAILPLVWGYLADVWSMQQAYWIAIPCYLFIVYYAFGGHKVRSWGNKVK
jgi:fucose permease